jgi:hypothetical protein
MREMNLYVILMDGSLRISRGYCCGRKLEMRTRWIEKRGLDGGGNEIEEIASFLAMTRLNWKRGLDGE